MSIIDDIFEREVIAANAKADRDDERMAAAARGEPFFTNVATGPVTGLDELMPVDGWEQAARDALQRSVSQAGRLGVCEIDAPRPAMPPAHEPDCVIFGRSDGMDNRTVLAECTCPMGNL
jgi:hypothetical protein